LKANPPSKNPKPTEVNEGSQLSFFKNGKLMCEFNNLRQVFYCFGVSLFNYSQVELLEGESAYAMPPEARHYYCCLEETIPYKDLENNKIFKI
jgi:hypothetical protein